MEIWTGRVAAGTLVVLWSAEAFFPAFARSAGGLAQRARHLVVGLLNAGVSSIMALGLLAADNAARANGIGILRAVDWPWWLEFAFAFLALDLFHYCFHVLAHKTPVLWRFHALHHNAEQMEATLAMRFHAFEVGLQCLLTIPVAVVLGASITEVLAYNLVLLPVALFHHSDIRLSMRVDKALRLLIVTPRMHWVHHSRWQPETDSNYASVLSIWDRIFGTMRSRRRPEDLQVGLDGHRPEDVDSLVGMLTVPFGPSRSTNGQKPDAAELEPEPSLISTFVSPRRRRSQPGLRSSRLQAVANSRTART
jgi:sterol desaturase/sphingolipid hydroxylase (fatty acid hydroxylase superfamily)